MNKHTDSSDRGDSGSPELVFDSDAGRSLLLHPDVPVELPPRNGMRRFAFARVGLAVVALSGLALAPAASLAEPPPVVTADCEIKTTLSDGTPSGALAAGEICVRPPAGEPSPTPPPPPPPAAPAAPEPPAPDPPAVSPPPPPAAPAAPEPPAPDPPAVTPPPPPAPPAAAAVVQAGTATAPAGEQPPASTIAPVPPPANKVKSPSRSRADTRSGTPTKVRERSDRRGEQSPSPARKERSAPASGDGSGAAATYAALPASWTSLAPLSLPTFDVASFPIPPFLLPIYQAAAAQYGVPWEVLASINEIESDFGRNAGVSSAGAMGWMQFIYSSWKRWGTDSDADGARDPRNPVDAIFAAARYLRDAGAGTDLPKAIFAYNHADWYVNKVVERAREFAGLDRMLVASLSERALREDTRLYRARGNPFAGHGAIDPSAGQALLLTKRQLTRIVLHSDDIDVYPGGRKDIAAGHISRQVLATLVFLERSGLKPSVSSLTTGHSLRTTSGNISAHSYGHAVDISAINGIPISGNQGAGSITAKTLKKLVALQGYQRPNQVISLMTIDGQDNTLAMGDHDDHIHVGFPRVPQAPSHARPSDIRKLVEAFRARTTRR
ncbi:MAG: lytic transglycosylase domain-containing protein [Solirubrobacteraceae bacterium]